MRRTRPARRLLILMCDVLGRFMRLRVIPIPAARPR